MTAKKKPVVDPAEETPVLSLVEQAEAASAAEAEHRALSTANVGSVRPADGVEARVARLEALVRSRIGVDVLTPERAAAAAEVQDAAAEDAEA